MLICIDLFFFTLTALFIGYDLFFTLASFWGRTRGESKYIRFQTFAVIFAAYKEDAVILESVKSFIRQDYPKDKYRVIVVSDHMRPETNRALAELPIELLTPDFEHSMKHKSVSYALEYIGDGADKVVIMDADNITETDFLTRINKVTQDNIVLQAHRTLKNENTPIAIWDGLAEEINNTIFRKGRVNVGISSSLIGSGMVFDLGWFKAHMRKCETFAEDKELEILLASQNIFVDYADNIYVYDEKTSRKEVMTRQRSRWFHAQVIAFGLILKHFNKHSLNRNYVDKILQWVPFPRILKILIPVIFTLIWSIQDIHLAYKWLALIAGGVLTYGLAIPRKMHTRKLYMSLSKLPLLFSILTKGYIASLIRIKNKDTSFQSTPHDITIKKEEESHD
ncbi:glycosyltransferase family 2 protein [Parabacteroides sp. ZJ-118]|uniref:glycosyltransferase n=1 Tax=Parabacteroides sp. ZJ-118 TaxID=2709398 RepID=UPI001F1521EE|nr:glycosyltransferase family 2 protein [Parabacteroides sp. ZJ-118]